MRAALPLLLLALACLTAPLAQAQAPAPAAPSAQDEKTAPAAKRRPERRVENIQHEDSGSRIDEVREGGETKSITVQPKGDMPAYEVVPEHGTRNPAAMEREGGATGTRVWKVLGF